VRDFVNENGRSFQADNRLISIVIGRGPVNQEDYGMLSDEDGLAVSF